MANECVATVTTTITPTRTISKWRRILATLSMIVMLGAACGSTTTDEPAADFSQASAAVSSTDSATEEPEVEEPPEADETVSDTIDRSGLRVITYPTLGGTRLGIPTDVLTSSEGDFITLRRDGAPGVAILARTSQSGGNELPIESIDDFIAAAQQATGTTVTVTDTTISALGNELTLHEFRDGTAPQGPGVFGSRAFGFAANAWWTPAPVADLYLANIESGVLVMGATGPTTEAVDAALAMIDEVAPTLELLTADGSPDPRPSIDDRYVPIGEPLDFARATLDADGAPEFTTLFAPTEPGTYQMGNLSVPITATFGPGWFTALNFPTFVVIAELPPVGPGFRDIIFQQGVNAISGINLGATVNTPPVPITNIEAFLEIAPSNLGVSNVDTEATIGGLDAVRFDVLIDPASTCQPDDPCEFLFTNPEIDFATAINAGVIHRIWWIEGVPAGPLMITASAAEADAAWLDTRAEELLSTLEFGTNE